MKKNDQRGFSRVDLLAVIAALSILALTFAGDGRSNAEAAVCLNNMRQLARAQFLYAADYGYFPPNGSGIDQPNGFTWVPGTIGFDSDNTNVNRIAQSLLFNYVERNHRVFKCVSEQRTSRSTGGATRVRTVSMNHAVGTDPMNSERPVPGMFLDLTGSHTANRVFRCFARPSDIVNPTPANLFIFLDEHPDSINDGMFASPGPVAPSSLRWIDVPAAYHDDGGSFGFADGRAQIHRWNRPFTGSGVIITDPQMTSANRPDLQWLASKTSALRSEQP